MNWGKWIITVFVLFGAFIATIVAVCMRQDVDLISKNYYQEEIAYQQQLERKINTEKLTEKPVVQVVQGNLQVHFPFDHPVQAGEVILFRPSDKYLDHTFKLVPPIGKDYNFELLKSVKGIYRVKLQWKMNDKEYYLEKVITI